MSDLLIEYNITPLNLSQERFNDIVKKHYTYECFKKTSMDIDVIHTFLRNDKGQMCAILEDKENMILQVVDEDLNIVNLYPKDFCNYFSNSQIFQDLTYKYTIMLSIENGTTIV